MRRSLLSHSPHRSVPGISHKTHRVGQSVSHTACMRNDAMGPPCNAFFHVSGCVLPVFPAKPACFRLESAAAACFLHFSRSSRRGGDARGKSVKLTPRPSFGSVVAGAACAPQSMADAVERIHVSAASSLVSMAYPRSKTHPSAIPCGIQPHRRRGRSGIIRKPPVRECGGKD